MKACPECGKKDASDGVYQGIATLSALRLVAEIYGVKVYQCRECMSVTIEQ